MLDFYKSYVKTIDSDTRFKWGFIRYLYYGVGYHIMVYFSNESYMVGLL